MPAPRSSRFDDVYFSDSDGLAESSYVFLEGNKLESRLAATSRFVIAETGFGTGLNILNLWRLWDRVKKPHAQLFIYSFEKYPLSKAEIATALEPFAPQLDPYLNHLLDHYPLRVGGWHRLCLAKDVTLILVFDDINHALPQLHTKIDAWFLDGFTPSKNPDMWSDVLFAAMKRNATSTTTAASFTAAGDVRRRLSLSGFHVQKQKGYGQKREMIMAHYQGGEDKICAPHSVEKVAVIGAGLAGACVAYDLHQRNIAVTLFEKNHIASGASGNMRGLFNPRFSQQRHAQSEFYASAFAQAYHFFETHADKIDYVQIGSLHLFTDAEKEKRLRGAHENWDWHPDHMQTTDHGLFLPQAGSISPKALCAHLARDIPLLVYDVLDVAKTESGWRVGDHSFDAVIFAGGAEMVAHPFLSSLPIHTVRGQIITGKMEDPTPYNICYGGYCAPYAQDEVVLGSTFQPWLTDTSSREEDTQLILKNFYDAVPDKKDSITVTGARAALRCASKDRFPIIGALQGYEHLYVSTAHGSHGILSAGLGARLLADHLTNSVHSLPTATLNALSPARFLAVKKT